MKTFPLIISTPDGNRFQGEAYDLSLRGLEGDLAVLPGHTPMITAVREGECRVILPDNTERIGVCDGGLLTVGTDTVTLLTGRFDWNQ